MRILSDKLDFYDEMEGGRVIAVSRRGTSDHGPRYSIDTFWPNPLSFALSGLEFLDFRDFGAYCRNTVDHYLSEILSSVTHEQMAQHRPTPQCVPGASDDRRVHERVFLIVLTRLRTSIALSWFTRADTNQQDSDSSDSIDSVGPTFAHDF